MLVGLTAVGCVVIPLVRDEAVARLAQLLLMVIAVVLMVTWPAQCMTDRRSTDEG